LELYQETAINRLQCAYLAGFFDADGAIMASIERSAQLRFGFRVRLTIKLAQKNKTILEEIQSMIACGKIRLNRTVFELDIKDQTHVKKFIELVYPHCRVKRMQLELALTIIERKSSVESIQDMYAISLVADALAEKNVRSKGRRKNFSPMKGRYIC